MVTVAGAEGGFNTALVSFVALEVLKPQSEVNLTLMESPATAAAFDVYLILIACPPKTPESNEPVAPLGPSGNDHDQPVAAPTVVVAAGNAEAVYLYILAPQTFVVIAATVTVGAAGADNKVLVSLVAFEVPRPHDEVNATLIVSPETAAAFDVYLILIV
jgi:hypothetical protein